MTEDVRAVSPPVQLDGTHDLAGFQSGEAVLDSWLRQRALDNMAIAASTTYVTCAGSSVRVVGYYALCMGQILNREAAGAMRRNMPQQIPAVILARLATDRSWQGQGLGTALLRDAVRRSERAAREASARLLVVHAISPAVEAFYLHHGFVRLPLAMPVLALDLVKLRQHMET